MEALPFGIQSTFVQRAADLVLVILSAEVSGQFPGDGGGVPAGELVGENTPGVLHLVRADNPVLVEAHCVNENSEDIVLALLDLRQFVG